MTVRYAALLAAVNVGKRRIAMEDLRQLLAGLGYRDARTYLASGNAVFTANDERADEDTHAAKISAALRERYGFEVPCVVRGNSYLRAVIDACPFPANDVPGTQLHAIFHADPVATDRYADIDQPAFLPEEFRIGDRVIYLYLPNGMGRSQLAVALSKPAARVKGVLATGRNWNTVKALAEMTGT